MRTSTLIFIGLVGLGVALALPCSCSAQAFTNTEIERGLLPGASVPHNGAPYSEVYGFGYTWMFYPGYNGGRLAYLDYLDRLDRQRKFGDRWPTAKCGSDYQVEEINREYFMNSYGRYGTGWRLFGR